MKMILAMILFLILGFKSDPIRITKEGYANFVFGKISLSSIRRQYPDDRGLIYRLTDQEYLEAIRLKEQGIELFFSNGNNKNPDSVYFYQMEITDPCYARTDKNIKIGSTVEEVLKNYGPGKNSNVTDYKKISFLIYDWFTFSFNKGKVDRISVSYNE